MPRVFVSVGSNIDREQNIRSALCSLRSLYGPLEVSRVYESEPVGFDGELFYNLVAAFETDSSLEEVIKALGAVERQHGRIPENKGFQPRTLDLDVLLYGDLVRHAGGMDVPRPEIYQYAFVLRPLSELAPTLCHPETGLTFLECWRRFKDRKQRLWPVDLDW